MLKNIRVIYEDDWLLVVNKPAGLLIIPAPGKTARTLTDILNEDLKERGLQVRVHPCHRLDRETTGLIIFAKGKSIQQKVMDDFKQKRVRKSYIAFVHGSLPRNSGDIKSPIEGLPAYTSYKVLERRRDFVIIKVIPLTGRTNQIRLHFKNIGYPLVGEAKFAFRRDFKLRANRLCLHAGELEFTHPVTGKAIHLLVELPEDMRKFLEKHA
jgi:23S rRNA pseudouridine1911/1915/1917 synthase